MLGLLWRSCLTPDSGNLVVRKQGSGDVLWRLSFDHPSNTLLAGMRLGKDPQTGAEWYLTALGSPLPCELVPRVTLIW